MVTGKKEEVELNDGATPRATWSLGGDAVMQNTKHLPEEQRAEVRWLFFHSTTNGISIQKAAEDIGRDKTTLYIVMAGKYGADLKNMVVKIRAYRQLCEKRESLGNGAFVETSLAKKIWKMVLSVQDIIS